MTNTNRLEVVRDWTPRTLPGGKYCSPACGGHKGFCKRANYDRAVKDSDALAARLGEGWQPEVWENLGWHWRVSNGTVPDKGYDGEGVTIGFDCGKYRAEFRSQAEMANHVTQFFAEADAPEEAVGVLRQNVRTFIARLQAVLADTI